MYRNRKGFTLLELIVVVIIIGVLASLGFTQYTKLIEKGRSAEAKVTLGQIRSTQEMYKQENGDYTATIGNLAVSPPTSCTSTHYFSYGVTNATGTATRCAASGKTPQSTVAYTINLTYSTGAFGGSTGYY